MLANKLMSFLMLSTMLTPRADVRDPRRLTPRMQAYWVIALRVRVTIWAGMWKGMMEGGSLALRDLKEEGSSVQDICLAVLLYSQNKLSGCDPRSRDPC